MKLIRRRSKSASVFLITLMILLTIPFQPVLAAMIETDATLDITANIIKVQVVDEAHFLCVCLPL